MSSALSCGVKHRDHGGGFVPHALALALAAQALIASCAVVDLEQRQPVAPVTTEHSLYLVWHGQAHRAPGSETSTTSAAILTQRAVLAPEPVATIVTGGTLQKVLLDSELVNAPGVFPRELQQWSEARNRGPRDADAWLQRYPIFEVGNIDSIDMSLEQRQDIAQLVVDIRNGNDSELVRSARRYLSPDQERFLPWHELSKPERRRADELSLRRLTQAKRIAIRHGTDSALIPTPAKIVAQIVHGHPFADPGHGTAPLVAEYLHDADITDAHVLFVVSMAPLSVRLGDVWVTDPIKGSPVRPRDEHGLLVGADGKANADAADRFLRHPTVPPGVYITQNGEVIDTAGRYKNAFPTRPDGRVVAPQFEVAPYGDPRFWYVPPDIYEAWTTDASIPAALREKYRGIWTDGMSPGGSRAR